MKYDNLDEYLDALNGNPGLAFIPIGLVAEYRGVTRQAISMMAKTKKLDLVTIHQESDATQQTRGTWLGVTAESLERLLDKEEEEQEILETALEKLLEACAKRENPLILYSDAMQQIGLSWQNPHHRRRMGMLLGDISLRSLNDKRRRFPLSCIVVRKSRNWRENGQPTEAFFELAKNYDHKNWSKYRHREDYLESRIKMVTDYYRPKRAK